jgi:hypothetical protein
MIELIKNIRLKGYDALLVPLFSHCTVSMFRAHGDDGPYIVVYPPKDGLVHIELLEGMGNDAQVIQNADVSEADGIPVFDSYVTAVLSEPN